MIPYKLPEERETLIYYSELLNMGDVKKIIERDSLRSREEATLLAEFFWKAVEESNVQDKKNNCSSEIVFEKIIITLMAYFQSTGYEEIWEEVSGRS